jgi:hypothetical protein
MERACCPQLPNDDKKEKGHEMAGKAGRISLLGVTTPVLLLLFGQMPALAETKWL